MVRFYALDRPTDKVFDEVYFPVFAQNYLNHTDFFDSHPPLGKLIIAGSIRLVGNSPLGWRYFNAIAGLGLLAVITAFAYDLTGRKQTAVLALVFATLDPMALVESRVGLINVYLALFSIAGLWFFWRWWIKKKHPWLNYLLALLFFGAAAAVKWIGLGAFGACILFMVISTLLTRKRPPLTWKHALALLIIPFIYLLTFYPDIHRGQNLIWWHKSAYSYHAHLVATHPYGSAWWSWPLILRPIWLYFKTIGPGKISGIIELGNVVTWIGGLVAFVYACISLRWLETKKQQVIIFLISTYLALYLPWIVISRVKFIYHYFVPLLILLILLAVVVDNELLSQPKRRWIGITFIVAAAAFFLYFLPLLTGYPVAETFYRHHMWFRSWI